MHALALLNASAGTVAKLGGQDATARLRELLRGAGLEADGRLTRKMQIHHGEHGEHGEFSQNDFCNLRNPLSIRTILIGRKTLSCHDLRALRALRGE